MLTNQVRGAESTGAKEGRGAAVRALPMGVGRLSGWGVLILAAWACVCTVPSTFAQVFIADGLTRLHTSETVSLISHEAILPQSLPASAVTVRFQFGFSTSESPLPGFIPDAFTVTMQSADRSRTAVFLTADVHGVIAAPSSEGALALDPAAFTLVPVAWPAAVPQGASAVAFSVTVPLSSWARGEGTRLYLDLFDNQNGVASDAWVQDFAAVPEPSAMVWTAFSLLCLASIRSVWSSKRLPAGR